LNIYLLKGMLEILGIKKEIIIASELKTAGKADDRLIDILKKIEADAYLAGPGGKGYMDLEKYKKNKIKVIFREFSHPLYNQQFGDFIPNLSAVDYIFNCQEKFEYEASKID